MALRRTLSTAVAAACLLAAPPARASGSWLIPPVDGAIERAFVAPEGPFGAGHRGIDYAAGAGTLVRAAAPGTVTFAGPVAGTVAVTIDHGGGLSTTYSSLASALVSAGETVDQGRWIGRSGVAHAGGEPGLHFGVKLRGDYVDPASYLGPLDVSSAIHLAPTTWRPPDVLTEGFRSAFEDPGSYRSACVPAESLPAAPGPPNGNVAVMVAGIGTATAGGASPRIYRNTPALLGYPPASTYRFSYAGSHGPSLHEPYARVETYRGLRASAERLRTLLERIATRAPGRHVDLIAHSQGGLVARLFLESLAGSWDPKLPVVDHLVTLSTPNSGAPLAGDVAGLDRTLTGGKLMDAVSQWARSGGPIPDPRSPATAELAPGSGFLDALAREDVAFGTRALSLGIANDWLVPPDRAALPHELSPVVGPRNLSGHGAITSSPEALGIAHAFLRDARPPCTGSWDVWGPRVGAAVGWSEARLPWLYGQAERQVVGTPLWWVLHHT